MHLTPTSDLAQAANLSWLVDVHPRALYTDPQIAAALRALFTDAQFETFRRRHGGVDVRELDELTVAAYPATTLFLAHGLFEPARIETAFGARANVEGRGIDRKGGALGSIVRTWGDVRGDRQQLAIFGHEVLGLEVGRFGPLRASEFFAEERLKKASPALRATPLDRAVQLVGNGPLTAFAPGPFEGEYAQALGGLFRAATAVALSVRIAAPGSAAPDDGRLAVRLALLGTFETDEVEAATQRFAAAIHVVSESALGRLCGLNAPVAGPRVHAESDALVAELTVAATPLLRGLGAATGASVDDILHR
ncbi:MAG TPA: hypothetical protein VNO21_08175 [Polyangiaceae bacterium]|nr:hypothetical protein [Polyangiaceae bacterium]